MYRFAYSEDTADEADEEGLSLVGSAVKGTGDIVNMHVFPEDKRAWQVVIFSAAVLLAECYGKFKLPFCPPITHIWNACMGGKPSFQYRLDNFFCT